MDRKQEDGDTFLTRQKGRRTRTLYHEFNTQSAIPSPTNDTIATKQQQTLEPLVFERKIKQEFFVCLLFLVV